MAAAIVAVTSPSSLAAAAFPSSLLVASSHCIRSRMKPAVVDRSQRRPGPSQASCFALGSFVMEEIEPREMEDVSCVMCQKIIV